MLKIEYTPEKLSGKNSKNGEQVIEEEKYNIVNEDGSIVAQVWYRLDDSDYARLNAARICQCVNNFDELLKALKEAIGIIATDGARLGYGRLYGGSDDYEKTARKIQDVIAHAENQG